MRIKLNVLRLPSLLLLGCCALPALADNSGIYNPGSLKTANGEQVYQHICQGCHMPDGKGAVGAGRYPAFAGNPTMASAQYMALTVLNGRRDMPGFAADHTANGKFFGKVSLTDEQVAGVINYIRTHFGNSYKDSLSAADVAAMHP